MRANRSFQEVKSNGESCKIEVRQNSEWASGANYTVRISRLKSRFWASYRCVEIKIDGVHIGYWNAPPVGSWLGSGVGNHYLWMNGGRSARGNDRKIYLSASAERDSDTMFFNSREFTYNKNFSRGNSRQGFANLSVSVIKVRSSGSWWDSVYGNIELYTSKIADVDGVSLTVTVDSTSTSNRQIRITGNFNNKESFYTGRITGPGVDVSWGGGSKTVTQTVTYSMFNTNRTYTLTIKGNDGTQYSNISKSTGNIEPHGCGIWVRNGGTTKESYTVWYKQAGRVEPVLVNEAWVRRGSSNYKTTKK